jgi:hypothetical protein
VSRAGIVLPRLRDVFAASLADPYPDVDVYLGPIVSGDPDDAVFVGYDGNPFGEMETVIHTQQWGALGNKARDEEFDVRCAILNRSGQTDADGVAAALARLYGMFSAVADGVHSDPSIQLGPPVTPVMSCSIRGLGSFVPLTEVGVEPRVGFNVHVRTRL